MIIKDYKYNRHRNSSNTKLGVAKSNSRFSSSKNLSNKKLPSVSSKDTKGEKKHGSKQSSTLFPTSTQNLKPKSFILKSTMDAGTTTNNDDSCYVYKQQNYKNATFYDGEENYDSSIMEEFIKNNDNVIKQGLKMPIEFRVNQKTNILK